MQALHSPGSSSITYICSITELTHSSGNNLTTGCVRCLSQHSWRRSRLSWPPRSSSQTSRSNLSPGAIVAAASRSRTLAATSRSALQTQQGPAMSSGPATQLVEEEALRDAAKNALRESGLYIKEEWVRDFLVESIVSELQEGGLPGSADQAQTRFEQLIFDNLQQAENDEVADFAAALHRLLTEAAEAAMAALGAGSSCDDDEDGGGVIGGCAMCGRQMPLTFHHLIPRDVHNKYKKKGMALEELNRGIDVCRPCHSAIHRTYDNKTLAAQYHTLELLMKSEPLQRFVGWAQKQKVTTRQDISNSTFRYRR